VADLVFLWRTQADASNNTRHVNMK